MRHSPIYTKRKNSQSTNKANGDKKYQTNTTFVGSSRKNSHEIIETSVSKFIDRKNRKMEFLCSIDGKSHRKKIFKLTPRETAGELLETIEYS